MINTITNANCYNNGLRLAGKLSEVTLPDVKIKTEDTQALGMYGTVEIPIGLEKMEAKFKFNAIYADAWREESPHKVEYLTLPAQKVGKLNFLNFNNYGY